MAKWQVTEVQRYLKGADYPASGRDLASVAERNGAEGELVQALSGIRGQVDGPTEVMKKLSGDLGGSTPGPTKDRGPRDDVERPAWQVDEVQRYLGGVDYPASGKELADRARANGAPDDLVDALAGVGRANGPTEVMQELQPHLGGPEGARSSG
jgi:hypothetical protein